VLVGAGERALAVPEQLARSTDSAIAPRSTAMNTPAARADWRWISRAISSLPVPFSPRISTLASVGAAFATS
jgi:hypothetical protein